METSDGHASLIVTDVDDISNLSPGRDRIENGIEDVTLDILPDMLLANDQVGGLGGANLSVAGVANARHGSVSLDGNGVVHFTPELKQAANDGRWVWVA